MNRDDRGSALVWAMALFLVIIVFLAFLVPAAASTITLSQNKNHERQAHYTAKSVAEMISEYITSDATKDPGKSILEKAKAADADDGISWDVNGLKEDMGTCAVNVRFSGGILYVKATATYAKETQSVVMKLRQGNAAGNIEAADTYVSGYPGIRVNQVYGINTPLETTKGNSLKLAAGNLLVLNQTDASQDEIELDASNIVTDKNQSSAQIERTDTNALTQFFQGAVLYSQADVINEAPVVSQSLGSIVTSGNIVLSNANNLFRIKTNYKYSGNNTGYSLYSCKTVKLAGQVEVPKPGNISTNLTCKNLILEGRDVDKTSDIPGGVTLSELSIWVRDAVKLDYVTITSREKVGPIRGAGPVTITNKYGPTLIQGATAATSDYGTLNGTGITITCTEKDNEVHITGDVVSYNQTSRQNAIDTYIKEQKAKDSTFDEAPYEERKNDYKGNVVIDGGSADGKGVIIDKSILANGEVTLKGKVLIKGNVWGTKITKEGSDVTIMGVEKARYTGTTSDNTTTNLTRITDVIAQAQTKAPQKIESIPNITKVSAGKIKSTLELRNSDNPVNAYEYTGDCNLGKMTINSYGDVYLIVDEGCTVSVDSIESQVLIGNVYFIVKKNGKLRLNDVNNTKNTIFHTAIYAEDEGQIQIGNDTQLLGSIDGGTLIVGENVSYQYEVANTLSGSVSKGQSEWKVIQYDE